MTFFFDHNLSWKLAVILRILDIDAYGLKEKFDEGVKDEEWIPQVAAWGWIVLTGDERIRTRPAEKQALIQNGLIALFMPKTFQDKGQ